jgi:hypothetical protein
VQGTPYTINLSSIYVSAKAYAYNETTKINDTAQTPENGSATISVPSGTPVTIYPTVTGSLYGNLYNVTAVKNVSGEAGYTVSCFKNDGQKITFETPKNTSSEVVSYTVTISSYEYPTIGCTLIINVEGTGEDEANQQKALEDATEKLREATEGLKNRESVSDNN